MASTGSVLSSQMSKSNRKVAQLVEKNPTFVEKQPTFSVKKQPRNSRTGRKSWSNSPYIVDPPTYSGQFPFKHGRPVMGPNDTTSYEMASTGSVLCSQMQFCFTSSFPPGLGCPCPPTGHSHSLEDPSTELIVNPFRVSVLGAIATFTGNFNFDVNSVVLVNL